MTIDNEKINVLISHTSPLFEPPAHCASNNSYGTPSSKLSLTARPASQSATVCGCSAAET